MAFQAGYSGTPLPQKFGLKDGQRVAFLKLPEELAALRTCRDFGASFTAPGGERALDFVQIFTKVRAELAETLKVFRRQIKPDGMIWASWPKKASKISTDITEDVVREEAFPLDLVDVKVCAVDEVWSGLKLVIRKDKR